MSSVDATSIRGRQSTWALLIRLQSRFSFLQIIATMAVFAYGVTSLPGLASWPSIKLILCLAALVGLAATGQTLLILLGGFDLSVAGFIVSSALIVTVIHESLGIPFAFALLISIVGAAVLGGLAGYICHRFDVQPLIVTLAIGTIALGLTQTQTPGGLTFGANAPEWLIHLSSSNSKTFGIDFPPLAVIWAAVGIVMAIFLHRTVVGRRLLATGASPGAARYSLVKTRRFWVGTFAFSGVASALVGLLVAGFSGAITTESGDPYLFQCVIAVLVGGTIFGGPGDYSRTIVGALFITVVNIVLVGHGATQADQQIIYGAAMLLAVSLYGRSRRLRDRV
jgi:ribose transport system permease protein